jgi:hypothetical protein
MKVRHRHLMKNWYPQLSTEHCVRHAMPVLRLLFLPLLLVLACGAPPTPTAPLDDAGPVDAGGAIEPIDGGLGNDAGVSDGGAFDAGVSDAGLAIIAPARTWTWVPLPGSTCGSGSPTGIGVWLEPGSRRLVLYLEGGGSCATAETCWVRPTAANMTGYGATEFQREEKLTQLMFFDTRPQSSNPFRGANLVFVPYCTGDLHSGTRVETLMVQGQPRPTFFTGAINVRNALVALSATFPSLDRVILAGTSAGGAGTTFHTSTVKAALRTRVDVVNDSAPNLAGAVDSSRFALWGTSLPCATCTTPELVHAHNRSLDPSARYAFLSFRYDATVAPGIDLLMSPWVATTLTADPNARSLVVNNPMRMSQHVVSTKPQPQLVTAVNEFLSAMLLDGPWMSRVLTP